MRRFPSAMWPCEGPLVHVLNGDYPAADLRRMSLPGLEHLVSKLVQRTSKPSSKPQWWPSELHFGRPLDLGLRSEREVKLAFKQLIVSCCQFFENNRRKSSSSSKHQFLHYFALKPKRSKGAEAVKSPPPALAKLAACPTVPFSSDVGRLMIAKEQLGMSEELKLKRLERSEWYTNKGAARGTEPQFSVGIPKELGYCHKYKFPKRQQRQGGRAFNGRFLARFCTPCSVVLTRLDLNKIKNKTKNRKLVVLIKYKEKECCDKISTRSSLRLKSG